MFRWLRSRRRTITRYWVNGHGPYETAAERDEMHATLSEVAGWNRRALEASRTVNHDAATFADRP